MSNSSTSAACACAAGSPPAPPPRLYEDGGHEMAPKPPNVRSAPAEPWRFSGVVNVVRGPRDRPQPPPSFAPVCIFPWMPLKRLRYPSLDALLARELIREEHEGTAALLPRPPRAQARRLLPPPRLP